MNATCSEQVAPHVETRKLEAPTSTNQPQNGHSRGHSFLHRAPTLALLQYNSGEAGECLTDL